MAGPGGGPPRRSHTKSRKGCETCKRRHIRCDENFPQCRNCTKHKIRCPYNDMPIPDDRSASPEKPDLMWTPEIEAAISHWQQTGSFPFPALNIYPAPNPQEYTVEELRLLYHITSVCNELNAIDANNFTLWTRQIPTILRIAATNKYVMHALLGFAASHIAWLTECPLVSNMSYEHRGYALSGIQDAIATFSPTTSDAVLAASLVLSWQAADWKSWTQLMTGTSSVINAMGDWKSESQFGDFIAETDTFPTAPPSPTPDHRPAQPRDEDFQAFNQTIHQLQKVESFLKASKAETKPISQLLSFVKAARKVSPTASVSQQFDRLQQLRSWLFWLPISFLQKNQGTPNALLVIAQYYTVALVMERLFPEIGAAYFGSMCVGPIEEIARRLGSFHVAEPSALTPSTLMAFPMETLNQFRGRMGWVQPVRTPSFPQFTTPSYYGTPPAPLQSVPAVTETYLPYGQNPSFSYSTESLSIFGTPEPASNSAVSPYSSHNFLNIPSPVHTVPYSPASSTFEGSYAAYSDTEDYGAFDFSGLAAMGTSDMLGGTSNFGGFVAPIQPVWN